MKNVLRGLLLCMTVILLLSLLTFEARANDAASGFCGVDVTWSYDGEGTLTISGSGDIYDYTSTYALPWDGLTLRKVVIEHGVTGIGSLAFYGRTRLTTIVIPDTVTTIGERAFAYSGLTEITIPDSVTTIGNSAFSECGSLQRVTLGKGLTSIGDKTFYHCGSLTAIAIPDRVTSIGEYAFWNCDALTTVTVGDGVTEIDNRAFEDCSALTTVTLGRNVRRIGWCTFYNCAELESLVIPGSMTSIDGYAFSGCASLTSVQIKDAAAEIGQYAFQDCANLTSLRLGSRLTRISYKAFLNCAKLKQVVVPDTVTRIDDAVFSGCGSLESIAVPFIGAYLKTTPNTYGNPFGYFFGTDYYSGSIGIEQHFDDSIETKCYYIPRLLRDVTVTGGTIPGGAFENYTWLRTVTLGDGVTGIGDAAFRQCESLTGIVVPDSATYLGSRAFDSCDSLTTAVIGNGVKTIGYCAFDYCVNLTEVTIGSGVERIESYAFSTCRKLTSLTIPDSVTDIYEGAFMHCESLASITLGEGLITLGSNVFQYCNSLMEIKIPDKVISIGEQSIYNCDSLLSVTIGKDVTSIGRNVFNNCSRLDHVLYRGTQEQWDRNIGMRFYRATLHVDATGDEVKRYETEFGTYYYCSICEKLLWNDGQVLSVEVLSLPEKVKYLARRDPLDLTGGAVLIRMADGSTLTKPMDQLQVTGFDNTVPGECVLRVAVVDKAVTFPVLITTATVTFLDYDGSVIARDAYLYGDEVKIPADPVREEVNGVKYTFSGWDKPVTAVEGDAVYTAVYSSGKIRYTVRFVDHDGTLISSESYYYGDTVNIPEPPEREPDNRYHYSFSGWSGEVTQCCGDATYSARYQKTLHEYERAETTAPSCTEKGFTTFFCSCGYSYVGDYVAPSGHALGEWIVLESPTCTDAGLERRDCMACDYYENRMTRPTGHTYETVVTKPTCTEKGFTTHVCICGESYVDSYVSPKGHLWDDGIVTKEPTEGTEGEMSYLCTACGEIKTEILPPLEHIHWYNPVVTEPTCVDKGFTTYTCSCGDAYTQDFVRPLGHSWGYWLIEQEPVAGVGKMYHVCQTCGSQERSDLEMPLTDVPNGKYFSKPVFWAYANGITKGKTQTEFRRDAECTRKQIVTFLWRAAGQPEPESMVNPFTDVKRGDQFEKAILWAYYEGITSGTGDGSTFSPENACTRKQIVTFLWRFYGEPAPSDPTIRFTDVKNDRFASAILWAAEQGITTGTGDGSTFSPESICTRGQIVTFLYRALV